MKKHKHLPHVLNVSHSPYINRTYSVFIISSWSSHFAAEPNDLEFKIGAENTQCSACVFKDEARPPWWSLRQEQIWSR